MDIHQDGDRTRPFLDQLQITTEIGKPVRCRTFHPRRRIIAVAPQGDMFGKSGTDDREVSRVRSRFGFDPNFNLDVLDGTPAGVQMDRKIFVPGAALKDFADDLYGPLHQLRHDLPFVRVVQVGIMVQHAWIIDLLGLIVRKQRRVAAEQIDPTRADLQGRSSIVEGGRGSAQYGNPLAGKGREIDILGTLRVAVARHPTADGTGDIGLPETDHAGRRHKLSGRKLSVLPPWSRSRRSPPSTGSPRVTRTQFSTGK